MAGLDLISIAEFKIYKEISSDKYDDKISQIIANVSDFVKTYCNRTFIDYNTTDKVEYLDGSSGVLYPTEFPILNVTSVENTPDGGQTYETLVLGTNYLIDLRKDAVVTMYGEAFPKTYYAVNDIKLTYTGGYTDVPEDVKVACMDLVEFYKEGEYTPKRVMSGATQDNQAFRLMFTSNLPAHIKRVLDMYRTTI